MSLNVKLVVENPTILHDDGLETGFSDLAIRCGVYHYLWNPTTNAGIKTAEELIRPLQIGIEVLECNKKHFTNLFYDKLYHSFLDFLSEYLVACVAHPDALIQAEYGD